MPNQKEHKQTRGRPNTPEDVLKEKIMRAAVQALLEDGYALTTIDNVAKRAGVAKKTIYRFIENRDDLVEKVVLSWTDNFVPLFERTAKTQDDFFLLLQNNLETIMQTVLSQDAIGLYRLLQTDFAQKTVLLEKYQQNGIERSQRLLSKWLALHAENNIIEQQNFDTLSDLILSMAIAEPLRQTSLGLSPAGLTEAFTLRLQDVIRFLQLRM